MNDTIANAISAAEGLLMNVRMVNATFAALAETQSPRHVAARRNKKVSDVVSNREVGPQTGFADSGEE